MGLNTWKHGNKLDEKAWNSPNAKPSLWISMVWSPVPALEELFNQLWCIREILGTRCCVGSSTSLRHAANLPKRCTVWDFDIFEVSNNAGTITDMMTWCIQLMLCYCIFQPSDVPRAKCSPGTTLPGLPNSKEAFLELRRQNCKVKFNSKLNLFYRSQTLRFLALQRPMINMFLSSQRKTAPALLQCFFGRNSPTLTYNCWWGRMITWYHMWTRKMVAWCLGPVNIT